MKTIALEICAGWVDDCVTAAAGNADRIELNSALAVGGLTPSLGALVEAKERVDLPIIVMVRPRPGGFCYSETEFSTMVRDAEMLVRHGADGIAFGILHRNGDIDTPRCKMLIDRVKPQQAVFHRAFDVVPDPSEALEALIRLGFTRLLTSGQAINALEGGQTIKSLREQASGRIEILPGCGITVATVIEVLARTGCDQVHASLSGLRSDPSTMANPAVSFNASTPPPDDTFVATDPDAVSAVRQLLDSRNCSESLPGTLLSPH